MFSISTKSLAYYFDATIGCRNMRIYGWQFPSAYWPDSLVIHESWSISAYWIVSNVTRPELNRVYNVVFGIRIPDADSRTYSNTAQEFQNVLLYEWVSLNESG